MRQAVPQQIRAAQSIPMRNMIRQQQVPMRFRTATPRPKQVPSQQNIAQVSRPNVTQVPQYKNQISLNRSLPVAQQSAQVTSGGLLSGSSQKSASDLVQAHRMAQPRKPAVEVCSIYFYFCKCHKKILFLIAILRFISIFTTL